VPVYIASGVLGCAVAGAVASDDGGDPAGRGWAFLFIVPVILWAEVYAPRKDMRGAAEALGWRRLPTTKTDALQGDSFLAPGGDVEANDLIEGPDGAQAFWIAGVRAGHHVVVLRPIDPPSPGLVTVRKRRRVGTLPPDVGRTISVGDQEFDERFRTTTESPEFAHGVLTPEVRALIAAHPEYRLRIDGRRALAFRASLPSTAVVAGLVDFLDRVVAAIPADAWPAAGTTPLGRSR